MTKKTLFALAVSLLFVGCLSDGSYDCSKVTSGDDDYSDDSSKPAGILSAPQTDSTVDSMCPALKGQSQCCSNSYFSDAKGKLKNVALKGGLKMQAEPRIGLFRKLANDVSQYYFNTLTSDVGSNFNNQVMPNATTYNMDPANDKFNASLYVRLILGGLIGAVKNSNPPPNKTCIEVQGQATLNAQSAALMAFARDIAAVRNASTLFFFIDQFLVNITDTILSSVPPSDQCANVLLKLTCAKCGKSIPKLCNSICSAAAKGCFAPYFVALNPQFDILWDVTSQLVQFLNTTLTDMFVQQNTIRQALINDWNTVCGTNVSSQLGGNLRPRGVGVGFLKQAQALLKSGLLSYNGTAASLCSLKSSKSKCWDGQKELNDDGSEFSEEGVRGQNKNPAGSFDEQTLTQQAVQIGLPVNNFFSTPNVSMVIPAAITITQGQVYSGAAAILSMPLLLLVVLALSV